MILFQCKDIKSINHNLSNDSFTDIKLIPVWCLDFEVNGNGAEDGGYTIRINAITGDEIA